MGRTQDRTWRIHPDPDTGVVDPGEVIGALQEAAVILLRVGGGVTVVPERFAHPRTGEWLTHAVNVKWTSFVPPIQPPAPWFVRGEESEGLPGIDEEALATIEGQEPYESDAAPPVGHCTCGHDGADHHPHNSDPPSYECLVPECPCEEFQAAEEPALSLE